MDYSKKIKNIEYENIIWGIYIIIIILNFISNEYEKKYYISKNIKYRKIYKYINIFSLSILLIIYLYTEVGNYKNYHNKSKSKEKDKFKTISLTASTLILISGLLLLYNAIFDNTIEEDIALE